MVTNERPTNSRNAWILTYTPAADEPRVLRQASTLEAAGWKVVVCGYHGRNPVPDSWIFFPLQNDGEVSGRSAHMMHYARTLGFRLAKNAKGGQLLSEVASRLYYAGLPNWQRDRNTILRHAKENPEIAPHLVIAHDYPTCPPAADLKARYGAAMLVDSHEYMLAARPEDPEWMNSVRPIVKVMQDRFFAIADQVITVSPGIVDRLNSEQQLKRPVRLIRSLPKYEAQPFRPVSGAVSFLYHGLIDPARNLDLAIRAAALWKSEASLTIRGPADPGYLSFLRTLAADLGCESKIKIEEPVPFGELISAANKSDVGYFVYTGGTPQRDFALPNKFFEYCMAGLALMVSDLPAMSELTKRFSLGSVLSDLSPQSIADEVDKMTPAKVESFKRASLEAAKSLCWEREEREFLDIVDSICKER
jgi:glycosyltransferase involved in cell wall biosynthesis